MSALVVLAQETAAPSGLAALFPFILIVGLFFLLMMPQRRMRKRQQELQASLEVGQRVRTAGGIHGTITAIEEGTITLEVESGTLKVERRAIAGTIET